MRTRFRSLLGIVLGIGVGQALATGSAGAQGMAPGGSLGGYGGSMGSPGGGMGGAILPYAGRFGGFMPSRMGGGGGDLAFQRRSSSAMSPVRSSFSLSSMSDGMSSLSGGMGQGLGSRPGMSATPGLRGGMGSGGGMRPATPGGMGVMPPRIAYPFRQPPSLLGPASGSGMGMSM